VLKAALADIGSPLGTSLGFIFAWIFGPLLFFSLLFLFNNVFVMLKKNYKRTVSEKYGEVLS